MTVTFTALFPASSVVAAEVSQAWKLLASDGAAQDNFGYAVAISGTTAIIGTDNDSQGADSAYLFDTTSGTQLGKLLPNDGAQGDLFGSAVAISGTTALVGAQTDDDNGISSGSAYLFDTTTGAQVTKLLPGDGGAGDEPVAFQALQRVRGHFLRQAADLAAELIKALRPAVEKAEDQHRPFVGDPVEDHPGRTKGRIGIGGQDAAGCGFGQVT